MTIPRSRLPPWRAPCVWPPSLGGAEREPHRDLALSRRGAGEEQAPHVGADDQQHEPDAAHENPQDARKHGAKVDLAERDAAADVEESEARLARRSVPVVAELAR